MNTKPNRDITAEEPTTSTEWEKEWKLLFNEVLFRMYNLEIVPEIQSRINERIPGGSGFMMFENQDLEDFIRKLLTTRTNELLGAMGEIIEQDEPYENRNRHNEDYYLEENQQINTRNDLRSEQRQKLATLRQQYSV